jgi:dTDP-4-dehydrorhamnose reductase
MRVLVIGGTGLLGRALAKEWTADELLCTGSPDADIRDAEVVKRLVERHQPAWVILTAAYTDVDGCERDREKAHAVNVSGAVNVAQAARESGARLLMMSTDYVFDGAKRAPYEVDDPKRPLNVYGRTKSEGEDRVRELMPEACIVRTSWLFGIEGKCFPGSILALAQTRKELTVVADQQGRPTFNRDLARVIELLVKADARGLHHAANEGECSWFEFAQEILKRVGLSDVAVRPITTEELQRPALRPRYSVLSTRSLQAYGIVMRPWQHALVDYLQELPQRQETE